MTDDVDNLHDAIGTAKQFWAEVESFAPVLTKHPGFRARGREKLDARVRLARDGKSPAIVVDANGVQVRGVRPLRQLAKETIAEWEAEQGPVLEELVAEKRAAGSYLL